MDDSTERPVLTIGDATQAIVVAEELIRAVDEVNDHGPNYSTHCRGASDGVGIGGFPSPLQAGPLDQASNAKMLLAGLVSGFSERLFPDLLNRVSKAIEPSEKAAPTG